jgi:hypothetical protein
MIRLCPCLLPPLLLTAAASSIDNAPYTCWAGNDPGASVGARGQALFGENHVFFGDIGVSLLTGGLQFTTRPAGEKLNGEAIATKPLPIRGWLVHSPNRTYLDHVLDAAHRHNVNHLELSHDIIMYVDQITANPELAKLIEEIAARAAKKGIATYVWAHELNTKAKNLELDPESAAGRKFWESRRAAYEKALAACPSLAGVVLMFGSSHTEVWHIKSEEPFWQKLSMAERIQFVVRQVQSVVVGKHKKRLFVRDFNHGPHELRWLIEALRDFAGIIVISKPEPQDFQLYYPHSPSIGAYGNTPQILEMDLNGEYWGQSLIPVSQVGYLRYRLGHGVAKKISGAVGRIDTYANAALGTPSEINVFAFARLLENPDLSEQALYDEWLQKRHGLKPGSEAARGLQAILVRTFEMARKTYYTLGFWTWKELSSVPRTAASIDRCIVGRSNALWDPDQKGLEKRLARPDVATVRAILAEKAEAVGLADENVKAAAALKGQLAAEDFDDFQRRLRLAADGAHVYQAIAAAYWRIKLAVVVPDAAEATPEACDAALKALGQWADTLEKRYAKLAPVAAQAPRLRALAADLAREHIRK